MICAKCNAILPETMSICPVCSHIQGSRVDNPHPVPIVQASGGLTVNQVKKIMFGLVGVVAVIFVIKLFSGPAGTPESLEKFEWNAKYYKQEPKLHIEIANNKMVEQINIFKNLKPKVIIKKKEVEQSDHPDKEQGIAHIDSIISNLDGLIVLYELALKNELSKPTIESNKMKEYFENIRSADEMIIKIKNVLKI